MTSEVPELYQQLILEHNRNPRNFRMLEGGRRAEGHNPLCGDHLTVCVRIDHGVVTDASFLGSGCAIAKASASLMTDRVKGLDVAAARALAARFDRLVTAPAGSPVEDLGTLTAFAGVRLFPVRAKCALLAWRTLAAAIDARDDMVSTE
ncbi:MAG TPA: SUF system NifU family Fe-S cluster assembly protein [Vicinamibacterales bacterium]